MIEFRIGDWVWAHNRYYGQIINIIEDLVFVDHIGHGDCCMLFNTYELKHAETPPANYRYSFHIGVREDDEIV